MFPLVIGAFALALTPAVAIALKALAGTLVRLASFPTPEEDG